MSLWLSLVACFPSPSIKVFIETVNYLVSFSVLMPQHLVLKRWRLVFTNCTTLTIIYICFSFRHWAVQPIFAKPSVSQHWNQQSHSDNLGCQCWDAFWRHSINNRRKANFFIKCVFELFFSQLSRVFHNATNSSELQIMPRKWGWIQSYPVKSILNLGVNYDEQDKTNKTFWPW